MEKVGPIPTIGLGTWKLRGLECQETVKNALSLGYRHIDTADVYENHESIGRAIKGYPRDDLFITSKVYLPQTPPEKIDAAVKRFLNELNTPYLDLLLIHCPSDDKTNLMALEEMVKIKDKQQVTYIGVSNFASGQIERLSTYQFPILTNQVEMHPLLQQNKLLDYCQKKKIILTAYRPLGSGSITTHPVLQQIGKQHKKSAAQVILRWMIQKKCPVIPKTSQLERLKENYNIFDFVLSTIEMQTIAKLDANQRFCKAGDIEEEP